MSVQDEEGPTNSNPELFEDEFLAEKIIGHRIDENGCKFYLIRWHGFPENEDSWEPEEHLAQCPELKNEYESIDARTGLAMEPAKKNANAKAKRGGRTMAQPQENVACDVSAASASNNDSTPVPVGFDRGLEPQKILGAAAVDDDICFLMKWKGSDAADLVPRKEANVRCPQLVIKFYQNRIAWAQCSLEEGLDEAEDDTMLESNKDDQNDNYRA